VGIEDRLDVSFIARLVLIPEGRKLFFPPRKPLPALLPDGPGGGAWPQSADGERRVFFLDFLRREDRQQAP
jgi:hypothetical protein